MPLMSWKMMHCNIVGNEHKGRNIPVFQIETYRCPPKGGKVNADEYLVEMINRENELNTDQCKFEQVFRRPHHRPTDLLRMND